MDRAGTVRETPSLRLLSKHSATLTSEQNDPFEPVNAEAVAQRSTRLLSMNAAASC